MPQLKKWQCTIISPFFVDTKVAIVWNLLYHLWLQWEIKRRQSTLMLLSSAYNYVFSFWGGGVLATSCWKNANPTLLGDLSTVWYWHQRHSVSQQQEMSHQRTCHNLHQPTKHTTEDHWCKYWREEASALNLVESPLGESPQTNGVQQQTLFVFFRFRMINKSLMALFCLSVCSLFCFCFSVKSDGQRGKRCFFF